MAISTFDTLKFSRTLRDAGVPESQAEAEAQAIQEAFSEALNTQLATKTDIQRFEKELLIIKYMLCLVMVAVFMPCIKTVFYTSE